MTDDLSTDQRQLLEAACEMADRFNEYQVDEEGLMSRLGWDAGEFSRVRKELEDAGYLTRRGASQSSGQERSGSSERASICDRNP